MLLLILIVVKSSLASSPITSAPATAPPGSAVASGVELVPWVLLLVVVSPEVVVPHARIGAAAVVAEQVWPLTQFFSVSFFLQKIIDFAWRAKQ